MPPSNWKKRMKKPEVSRSKVITKTSVEINEIRTKKTIEKINETKSCFFEKVDNPLCRFIRKNKRVK